ncbi:hypothetical protein BC936DRAFT_143450 [Jimgerdemannia flammicorona]|uniref:FACT complex subunit POB3 n=2 Tax=Jimgerdemannia flammicorona TaxID=994334 RepID=A0A433DDU0_9FUNG|nr:hypothetical protein BC936DRAFT_143450 [Jimgerdemannia flammicorona]RUS31796.1 hypothetical protein BC938DRAFT_477038 [Jimgerdemannia flammicorona]
MGDSEKFEYENIYYGLEPEVGRLRLTAGGIGWKTPESARQNVVFATEFRKLHWLRVARNHQLRVTVKDGGVHKFDGFKKEDFEDIRDIVKTLYKMPLEPKEMSVKGWNWGKTEFQGSHLLFNVTNREMFELPLTQAIGSNKPGKNEVTINFVDPGQPVVGSNKDVDELVDITFYIPGTVPKEADEEEGAVRGEGKEDGEGEVNADAVFYETVKSKLEMGQLTSENIVQFQDVLCLTPRGRYNIDMFQDFLRLRGKTYDYKIMYSTIIKLFLLLKPDEIHVLFVIGLDPPLRQGQTRYPFLVFQFVRDEEIDVELNLDEETLTNKYEGKLQKTYDAPTYEVVSTIFRALTGRKVTVPGGYRSHHGAHAMKCSMKANEGYLYPLEKCFLFIPKPPTFIPLLEIASVTFSRVGAAGSSSRTFDLKFNMKGGTTTYQFSSINREEYANLEEFLKLKKIKMKSDLNEDAPVTYNEMDIDEDEDETGGVDGKRKRRRTEVDAGPKGEGDEEDEESPDEDFVAPDSDSDVAEEYDSNAGDMEEDEDEED